jgi:hypothetical protein
MIVYNLRLHLDSMDNDYDPQREAEAAMRLAAAAEGPERQRLIGLAIAWACPRVVRSAPSTVDAA